MVFFGEGLEASFILELATKVTSDLTRKVVIRKARDVTNLAFEVFFAKTLSSLVTLKLDECVQLEDTTLFAISENCKNLRKFSVTWCPYLKSPGVNALLVNCLKLKKLKLIGLKHVNDTAFTGLVLD